MARKPKAGRPAVEGKDREETVNPQIERFKEAVRPLETDETGEAFERAFRKIVPPKQTRSSAKRHVAEVNIIRPQSYRNY